MTSACFVKAMKHLCNGLLFMNEAKPPMQTHISLSVAAYALILAFGGCGASVSDHEVSSPSLQKGRAAEVDAARSRESQPMGRIVTQESLLEKKVYRAGVSEQGENQSQSVSPSIPQSIEEDLGSPDARVRYRALDYWEAKDSKAPLDPVFDALEDQDETVRGRATEIVERHWAVEQEREKREMGKEREKGEKEKSQGG